MSEPLPALVTWLAISLLGSLPAAAQPGYRGTDPTRLSGTYQLDRSRSDDPRRAADDATRGLPPDVRDRAYQNLMARLDAPDSLAIERNGRSVSVASSRGPRVIFDADGRERTEPGPGGLAMTTRADLQGDRLTVSTTGNRGSDFTVTFEVVGDILRVTRRLDSEVLSSPVTARSAYRRTSDDPRWNVYSDVRALVIPDGTRLIATLDRDLDTRSSREGERFTITLRSPGEYRNAVVNGVVTRVSGAQGRADMMLAFDSIRLPDGRTADFTGELEAVRTPDGASVRVERSGAVREPNQTAVTAQQGAVGAAVGALLGALVGGGKGAVAGAIVGGAGTVLVEGREVLDLPAGTELTILAGAPRGSEGPGGP
jgi:hypothetical protein